MPLTTAQKQSLRTDIAANTNTVLVNGVPTAINTLPNTSDANFAIATWYNEPASPAFTVWKKSVPITDVGDNIVGTELAGLSTLNNTRLQTVVILSANGVNPSLSDRRAFFDDIFSGAGGAATRAKLLILWKRLSTRIQKLFSTGTGSDASPATTAANVSDSFTIDFVDVEQARNS